MITSKATIQNDDRTRPNIDKYARKIWLGVCQTNFSKSGPGSPNYICQLFSGKSVTIIQVRQSFSALHGKSLLPIWPGGFLVFPQQANGIRWVLTATFTYSISAAQRHSSSAFSSSDGGSRPFAPACFLMAHGPLKLVLPSFQRQ